MMRFLTAFAIVFLLSAPAFSADHKLQNLQVAVVYNDTDIQFRFRFETDTPSWYHQYWVYHDGAWSLTEGGSPDKDSQGLYEDRISMMIDDGSIPDFEIAGGYSAVHEGMRSLHSEADPETVRAHPWIGGKLGESRVEKYLALSRTDEDASWNAVRSEEELLALRREGKFIDLWQWRSHRGNPAGFGDNGYILDYRHGASGQSSYAHNRNAERNGPRWMYNPEKTDGKSALRLEKLLKKEYGQNDLYYLHEDFAVEIDENRTWQNGDALPQRILRDASGSRGAIRAEGEWKDGAWHVRLTRSLAAPDPMDSKTFTHGHLYQVAFAVHQAVGARWHYVSAPLRLGLGTQEETELFIRGVYTDGDLNTAETQWTDVTLFYPGQVTWQWLRSDEHPGNEFVRDRMLPLNYRHTEEELTDFIAAHEALLEEEAAEDQ